MSLVTTPVRALPRCAACDSTRVTRITMTLTDGSRVVFSSCHACEEQTWRQLDGTPLEVATVLRRTARVRTA